MPRYHCLIWHLFWAETIGPCWADYRREEKINLALELFSIRKRRLEANLIALQIFEENS